MQTILLNNFFSRYFALSSVNIFYIHIIDIFLCKFINCAFIKLIIIKIQKIIYYI